MGFIAQLANTSTKSRKTVFPSLDNSRDLWRETFNYTNKEEVKPKRNVVPGGSYGRSVTTNASVKRLIQAMRSNAPGGWSDDRAEQSKHLVGITYVAIHRQNELLTQAEFEIFEKDPSHPDGKRPAGSSGASDLARILEHPNNDDNFGDLLANWNLQMDLTGTALTWMVPNQFSVPYEMYSIPTAIAIPQPVVNPEYPEGFYRIQPVYPYGPFSSYPTPASSVGAPIPAQWMLRFKYPHPILRYDGYSPQTALRLHLDEIEAMDRSRWYAMKRGINPSAVLNFEDTEGMQPLAEEEIERIKAEFENEQMGPENTGKLFVAAPGSKLDEWGRAPKDMAYQEGWEQLVSFALGGYGITKPAAGMIEDSSYSTLYATLKQLYWLTLDPKCDRYGKKLTRHLAPHFGDNLIIEVKCKRIDDHDITFQRVDRGMAAKCITKNETRKLLEFPVTPELWGEEIAGTEPLPPEAMPGDPLQAGTQDPNSLPQQEEELEDPGEEGLMYTQDEAEPKLVTQSRPLDVGANQGSMGRRMHTIRKRLRNHTYTLNGFHKAG